MPGKEKEYGLILPNKKKEISKHTTRTLNPLAISDDELEKEEGESLNWVEASLKKSAGNSGQQSLQKRLLREALEEDATVFQYDEVYDDLKASQQEEKERKTRQLEKKPKYIETILKHSEKRKLENERRLERKVQKEREAEGSEFADKESFVTPSYLKKLEELKQAEAANEREKLIEEKLDVHKHKNFGVFYNHLLKQRVGEKEIKQEPEDDKELSGISSEINTQKNLETKQKNYRTQDDLSDEEPSQIDHHNIDIKKEVITSSSSEDERSSYVEKKNGIEDKTQNNNNNLFRRNSRGIDKSNVRRRSSSKDRRDQKYKKKESDDRRSRDELDRGKRIDSERSRDRRTRQRSRSVDKKERSRDKRRERTNSREGDRSDRKRQRYKDSSGLERSRDKNRKGLSRSRSRDRTNGKREREDKDRKEREKRSKKSKSRSRSRDAHRKSDQKRGKSPEKHNKETDQKIKKENGEIHGGKKPPIKQSINTTLGATDVNKMKIEHRIKRFTEIFAKRTVNKIYEDALQRHFHRKAERESRRLI